MDINAWHRIQKYIKKGFRLELFRYMEKRNQKHLEFKQLKQCSITYIFLVQVCLGRTIRSLQCRVTMFAPKRVKGRGGSSVLKDECIPLQSPLLCFSPSLSFLPCLHGLCMCVCVAWCWMCEPNACGHHRERRGWRLGVGLGAVMSSSGSSYTLLQTHK